MNSGEIANWTTRLAEGDTAESALSRLENGRVNATWLTVCRYARLMGYEVEFKKMDDEDKSTLEKDHAG